MVAGTFGYLTMKGAESLYSSRKAIAVRHISVAKQNLKEDHASF